jgi:hypothetical protein
MEVLFWGVDENRHPVRERRAAGANYVPGTEGPDLQVLAKGPVKNCVSNVLRKLDTPNRTQSGLKAPAAGASRLG